MEEPLKIVGVWFDPDLQLKNWLVIRENTEAAIRLLSQRKFFLKGRAEFCALHIYYILLYRLLAIPLSCAELILLVRVFLIYCGDYRAPKVRHDVCCLHKSEGGLAMPDSSTDIAAQVTGRNVYAR